ncbi:hydroxyacylglutathione hydrolase [Candidatus Neptunochlamydia vexilliferae]|uniref:Hydroxyacylglutathione hydrolase n=1 Tax=Candidatus Neptunichlamydia vexilliferae TaxID=1651774 RepID=A0ABS0B0L6_9BACT|nr:hydroxyacylglutathione hydrolase [Candidatus Neptunochlamydia vexilliferae]MBF5059739.1 Hydroxyacylglutathione hydrolase [Candidatus Neptunochlamydia vexilliferae]
MTEKKTLGENQYLYQLKVLEDNYTYVISWDQNALVVDPGEGEPILKLLEEENLTLKNILITHYHDDHTGGVELLKKKTECRVIGPEDERIPDLDQSVDDGEELLFGPFSIEVFSTPGHTKPHLIYFFRDLHLLFTGDLLFTGGCGRLFEGTLEEMWNSLEKVLALPDDTAIYCGHEYTVANLEFAATVEPDNAALQKRLEEAKKKDVSVPSTLAEEKATNPFLRVQEESLQKGVNMVGQEPAAVFAHIRALKDNFSH